MIKALIRVSSVMASKVQGMVATCIRFILMKGIT